MKAKFPPKKMKQIGKAILVFLLKKMLRKKARTVKFKKEEINYLPHFVQSLFRKLFA